MYELLWIFEEDSKKERDEQDVNSGITMEYIELLSIRTWHFIFNIFVYFSVVLNHDHQSASTLFQIFQIQFLALIMWINDRNNVF